jgi:hypothetical protein
MSKFLTLSKQIGFLLIVFVLVSSIGLLQAAPKDSLEDTDSSSNDEIQNQRREDDFKELRQFLLTSNAEQRAEKREKQNFHKRELVSSIYY